jgi:PPOX class probable F420-dependent enzyme
MDIAEAVALARKQHRSVLATRRRDGGPQQSPVVHGVDEDGGIVISTREPAMKVANVRRDPRVALCILPDGFFGTWAQIEGTTEVVALPEAMPVLEDVYRQVAGEHEDWEKFRRAMRDERRVILRVTPTAAGPKRSG